MKRLYFLIVIALTILSQSCKQPKTIAYKNLKGNVFGTTYSIIYESSFDYQQSIDSLFHSVNKSLSTYMPTSDISKINQNDTTVIVDKMFAEVMQKSTRIFAETDGYFDPTVGNLVNAYGFGSKNGIKNFTEEELKEQLKYIGFNKVALKNGKIVKQYPEIYLEFNSIAKGYGIDVISRFLEAKSVKNYLVEIGGEVRARGISHRGKLWRVAIDDPNTDGTRTQSKYVDLDNQSMAGSGNYRKFRIDENGRKYVHTINPKTGLAQESNLLSAVVIAPLDCADVDGYATAFMAMGYQKTRNFLQKHTKIKVFLVYVDENKEIQQFSNF